MKKILFLLCMTCALVACVSNPTYIEQEGATLKTIQVTVNANEWSYTQQGAEDQFNNNYFYAVVEMPEITREVFNYGEVKAYAVFERNNTTYARKHLLPYVLHMEEPTNTGEWLYFTETYDFTYGIGWARIYYTISDFVYETTPPAMDFDIVITYPQEF